MVSSYKSRIKQNKFKCDNCIKLKEEEAKNNSTTNNNNSSSANNTNANSSLSEDSKQQQQQHESVNEQKQQNERTSSNAINNEDDEDESIVIAKCLDCNVNLCSNCLLEHQIINLDLNHKLVSLINKNQQHNDINNNNSKLSDKNNEFYVHDKNNNGVSKSKHVSPVTGSNKFYMKQSIHGSANTENQDLSSYLTNNQTIDMMNKLSVENNQYQQQSVLNLSSNSSDHFLLKRKSNIQEQQLQNKLQFQQQSSNMTKQEASNQLKQFQYQQHLINQQHLKQIKLQQQQQQKLHLMNQQQQQQTQLNILNHNQNTVLNLVTQSLNSSSSSNQSIVAPPITGSSGTLQQLTSSNDLSNNLLNIESEIQKTYDFYVQTLRERKEYLIKELNTIISFALVNNQTNINKQLKLQYQLEMKKQQLEKESEEELNELKSLNNANNEASTYLSPISQTSSPNNTTKEQETNETPRNASMLTQSLNNKLNNLNELNNLLSVNSQLINQLKQSNPLQSIEFLSNYSAIQTSIRNTFGYIRINNQQQSVQETNSTLPTSELNIITDLRPIKSQTNNPLSNNSTDSGLPSSSSSTGNSCYYENNMSSPVSIMRNKGINSTREMSSTSFSLSSLAMNSNNSNDAIMEACRGTKNGDGGSGEKIKSLFSNISDLKASSTWSTSLNNQNSLHFGLSDNGSAIDYEKFLSANGFHLSDDEASTIAKSHGSLKCLSNPNVSSLRSAASKSHSLTSLVDTENGLIGKSGLLEHYSFQQQQAKLLSSTSMGGSHMNSSIQLLRSKMIYHCKFGEFGISDGQFTEPSGVTINTNNDIIVADTNSHRIQIFDKDGRFKFKFGECGKRDGQLLYPNRVSIVKQTGDIVVTERSPTHQIQIYNKYGQFLRKFGANILQHPRGVCVDYKGRIVVVECKVMRVLIFDLYGNVLQKFDCSKYLEFPNGVCCSNPLNNPSLNTPEEIYISDNRAHCIKVFDYNGNFIRQIGGEGITNYPIGVGINSNNEILVADNHNNFNLTVFTPDGQLINALESKVKHAQCFDVGLMDDGSIVLASKDYRIYVYKYIGSNSNGNEFSEYNLSPSYLNSNSNLSPTATPFVVQSTKSNLFHMLSNANPIDQVLNHCSNNDDQNIIDNFEINHIENLFNDSIEQQHQNSSFDLTKSGNDAAQNYFSSNFSILNEIL